MSDTPTTGINNLTDEANAWEELLRSAFAEDLETLVEFAAAKLEHVDIQLDTIEELRLRVVIDTLTETDEYPATDYFIQRMIEEMVKKDPRLATLEEVGINMSIVEELKALVWDIKLPLLEGSNTHGNGWEPERPEWPGASSTKTYKSRVELLLTTRDIALHPGLIEILLQEVYMRRRKVGEDIGEVMRGSCSSNSGNDLMRKSAAKIARDSGFDLGAEPLRHPVIENMLRKVKSKAGSRRHRKNF